MKKNLEKQEMLSILSKCQKEFDENLKNKKVMFIFENKNRTIDKQEVFFPKSCFYHLTGIKVCDKNGQEVNCYSFYELLSKKRLREDSLFRKDNTTDLKLQVLNQLMRIDRTANMIGEFCGNNIFLQTEKVAGTVNACMGFVKGNEADIYIPNTVLKTDMREITTDRKNIIAISKKDYTERLYRNITYLKQNYAIEKILNNKKINKYINIKEIYSLDKISNTKIHDFLYSKE